MYLNMNLLDLYRWEHDALRAFAVPDSGDVVQAGDVLCIKEPFKKITYTEMVEKDGEQKERKTLIGVRYRSDDRVCMLPTALTIDGSKFKEAGRWSPSNQLPDFAVRRYAIVTKVDVKPLSRFTEGDLQPLCLDYASQNDPQLLVNGYLPYKNAELLYDWWKGHYKATLRDCNDPMATLLCIKPYISK